MKQVNETSRTFSFPSRVKFVGEDLVLTTRDFFVIISESDIKKIKEKVIGENKELLLQNETLLVHMKDNHIIIEQLRDSNKNRVLMVNTSIFS